MSTYTRLFSDARTGVENLITVIEEQESQIIELTGQVDSLTEENEHLREALHRANNDNLELGEKISELQNQ